jgi:DNA/RNA-binding domain of Phe-tRNA-synthetase-like protein
MTNFITDTSFWEIFPEAQINVLLVKGIGDNHSKENDPYLTKLLAEGKEAAKQFLTEETFSQNLVVAWRLQPIQNKKGRSFVN